MCQQLRFGRSGGCELVTQDIADAAMQNLAPAPEQILISCILDERVLEQDIGFGEPL
jgi:hypothetical protein